MSTYSNNVPSNVPEIARYNYNSNVDGATLRSVTTLALYNPNSTPAQIVLYLTLNSGDTNGYNNNQGWRGDGKNADVFLDSRPFLYDQGDDAHDLNSFYDGIYAGYGVLSIWFACTNFSNVKGLWVRNRAEAVKA